MMGHGDDFALKVALEDRVWALIDDEWGLSMCLCVFIAFDDEPSWCIRNTLREEINLSKTRIPVELNIRHTYEVKNLPFLHEIMQSIHYLLRRCMVVPVVKIEDVDICCPESLQA